MKKIGVIIALAAAKDSRPCLLDRYLSLGSSLPATSLITLAAKSTYTQVAGILSKVVSYSQP